MRGRSWGGTTRWVACAATLLAFVPAFVLAFVSAVTPAATASPAMPVAVAAAQPVAAVSVPAYATAAGIYARTRPGNGSPESLLPVVRPSGRSVLWGDWWGVGTATPALFHDGRWRFYDRAFGWDPTPVATAVYGTRGDRPVAGDWDGDGRTDLGVVRRGRWYVTTEARLRRGRVDRPVTSDRFDFGPPSAQPVAGDWDGDGSAGIAVYFAGRWLYRQSPGTGSDGSFGLRPASGASPFGNDRAVAGDWDGDGRDSVGIVSGPRWRLRGVVRSGGARVVTRVVPRPRAGVATPWPTTAGVDAAACPTADRAFRAPDLAVVAAQHLDVDVDPAPQSADADVRAGLVQAERFLLGAQWDRRWAPLRYRPYLDALAREKRQEDAVRRPAMAALAVAVGLRADGYDVHAVGRTRADALRYVDWFVRSLSCQHASVSPHGWGWGWQTAHWAALVGEAAWLVWDDLAPQTRAYVTSMLVSEADYQLTRPVDYWRDATGQVNPGREGNSAAEELAWNGALLDLAATMLPDSEHASGWRAKAVELQVASYAVPADLTSDEVVNGVALAERLAGTNALPDGTLINHRRVHPDYMGNIQHLWWSFDFAALAGSAVPRSAAAHAGLVYDAFSGVDFVAGAPSVSGHGSYRAPGGTIYGAGDPDDPRLYYPDGSDYGTVRWTPYISLDAHAAAYGLAPDAAWPAADALAAHARAQLELVAASGADDGRTFALDPAVARTQDRYHGREEYAAQQLATGWLALYLAGRTQVAVDDGFYPVSAPIEVDRGEFRGSTSPKRPSLSP